MSSEPDKAIIKKYLDGECTGEELIKVRAYLKTENAQQLFNEIWNEEWSEKINSVPEPAAPSQMQRWKEMMGQRIPDFASAQPTGIPFFKRNRFWQYAAIWLVVLTASGMLALNYNYKKESPKIAFEEKINPRGRRTIITLPDGSTVHLGASSKLRFAKNLLGPTRAIELEGEAFFEVVKAPNRPFIVHTKAITTRVLGTSFMVNAFKGKPASVSISTGKVQVARNTGKKSIRIATLLPGETVTWNEEKQASVLGKVKASDISGWKEGRLFFQETRLTDIADVLERWYNVDIKITHKNTAQKLVKVNLSTNISIDKIMKILSVAGDFKYKIQNDLITIN
ncbi:FecR family protein [Pedobacter caeni]|uniref:FecR family protein n=1 Tax=Pedobacter caeni TaxID=288992 RepID=A0A1M5BYC3_9SPHI|nr:FecR family protein [Pedobacter caeni]SHF47380.1 FecR family protein [Pedobacter caeni]